MLDRPADTFNRYVTSQPGAVDGHPWAPSGQGTGHVWPLLTGERGEYALASGDSATAVILLVALSNSATGVGLIPEQNWELADLAASPFGTDPTVDLHWLPERTRGRLGGPAVLGCRTVREPVSGHCREHDDNGPGNYVYPTDADFHAGAFDITDFRVILSPDASTVTFKLQVRDLSPTFGSPISAQLIDVYVHDPSAAITSTAASFAQRNYLIAASSAWSRLIEVQGFGQRYVDASGTTLGVVSISANEISRFIAFSVPTASLGTPGSGWGFTVVLTGQDGFSADQARGFASTPHPFEFGVCAAPSADPHCTVDPNTVPKAMDVITPAGVNQSTELDYTLGPVVIQGVTIP